VCHSILSCRLSLLLVVVSVGACTSAPPVATVDSGQLTARAVAAQAAGDYRTAADIYSRLAATSRGAQRVDYLLSAAELFVRADDIAAAGTAIERARPDAAPAQITAVEVLTARVAAGAGAPAEALERLNAVGPVGDPRLADLAAEARGLALFAVGRPIDAVRALSDREIWLDTAPQILANQRLIWDGLAAARALGPNQTAGGDETVEGWLALAPIARLEDSADEFRAALVGWRERFGTHPAATGILASIIAEQRLTLDFPQRIALLLPLGSTRRAPAQAVRDGFMAARLNDADSDDVEVSVYDTAIGGPTAAYRQALADGADFVVGPLLPEEVAEIVPLAGFVPTLALNYGPDSPVLPPAGLFQYALSPEDEARAIADRAYSAGQRRAVALFASTTRGYRLMDSFREEFEALGGEIVAASAYVPESQDASGPITEILNIARSDARHRRLQANLGQSVVFESRRRQDVDMIFLQATPGLGRLLAPQLRFHNAGDIPTYATSDIYDTARRGGDSDLNGVMFPDLPLLVAPDEQAAAFAATVNSLWPQRAGQWIRFYGFGFDAYNLIRPVFRTDPAMWPLAGVTGLLDLAADGRVHRALPFAQFRNGRPDALPPVVVPPAGAGAPLNARDFVGSR